MRNDLPETCFSTLPGTGDLIILKRGETGYYRSDWETGDKAKNQEIADLHNRESGITPAQVVAMQVGSMCGFHVLGATPQIYFDEAKLVSTHPLGLSAVLYAGDSLHENVTGCVHEYQIAGKTCFYLELVSIPESMMGVDSDGILWPDMVHGRPLVPVSLTWEENGGCKMTLERGAVTNIKEVNDDYQITTKVCVGAVEYAMGELDEKIPFYVTWERTPANDRDNQNNYYWGHYFRSREEAVQDLCTRAREKYKMLEETHRPTKKPSIKEQLTVKPVSRDQPAKTRDTGAR